MDHEDMSFHSDSDGDEADFAAELAAIKAGQRALLASPDTISPKKWNAYTSKIIYADLEPIYPEESNKDRGAKALDEVPVFDATERTKLLAEIDSLVKQVDHFRGARDKLTRVLKEVHEKDKKQLESMREALMKANAEILSSKKLIWGKDREMASVINKLNNAEIENKRLKQTRTKKARSDARAEVEKESGAQSYAFREIQELKATLDVCRVDLSEQRKNLVEQSALRAQAENVSRDMETRAIRAEQMLVATEKLFNDGEIKAAAHIAKLYDDVKVLRNGLVDLNGELASQASRGQLELGEMERERRVIATKLDVLLQENHMLLEQCAHQDKSLANQSAMLGSLSAHVHQAPIGSPHRDRRQEDSRKALQQVHLEGLSPPPSGRAGAAAHSLVNHGSLSPTAKRGLLLPLMDEHGGSDAGEQDLRHLKQQLHQSENEAKRLKLSLKEAKEALEASQKQQKGHSLTRSPVPSSDPHKLTLTPPKGVGAAKAAAAADKHKLEMHKLKEEFSRDATATANRVKAMAGTLEFLQSENVKLAKQLERNGMDVNVSGAAGLPSSSATAPAPGRGAAADTFETQQELALAKLQVKSLRANLIQVNREVARLKHSRSGSSEAGARGAGGGVTREKPRRGAGMDANWSSPASASDFDSTGEVEAKDDDSTQRFYSSKKMQSGRGGEVMSAISSRNQSPSRDYRNTSSAAEQRVLHRVLNSGNSGGGGGTPLASPSASGSHSMGFEDGVGATMADVLTLQRELDTARRIISSLEAKLAKAEYRYQSINTLLQNIPSTLNVANAEKRVLEAKLQKQLETHSFSMAALRTDAQKEVASLQQMLELETAEKRALSAQAQQQADLVATLNERLDKQQHALIQAGGFNATMASSFADWAPSMAPAAAFPPQAPAQQQQQQTRHVEALSSPVRRPLSSYTPTGSPGKTPATDAASLQPFHLLAYDHSADSMLSVNQDNFNRLQQALLSIS